MDIRIYEFIIILVFGLICSYYKKKTLYVWSIIIVLLLESGLRSTVVGPDTINYKYIFDSSLSVSWKEVLQSFIDTYQYGTDRDPGFAVIIKLVQVFSKDFNMFLIVCGIVFFIPLGCIINKYTSNVIECVFAFALYVALFRIIALSGVRQQVALGFSFLAFYSFLKDKRITSIILILLGSLIHVTCLLCLSWFVLKPVKETWMSAVIFICICLIPIVYNMSGNIMLWMASFIKNDYYATYGEGEMQGGAGTYFLLMEVLAIWCALALKKATTDKTVHSFFLNIPMIILLTPLIMLNGSMIRMGEYFTLYMMILVPLSINKIIPKQHRTIVYCAMIGILLLLTFQSTQKYYFFWQVAGY